MHRRAEGGDEGSRSGPKPAGPYRHPWTGGDGVSHRKRCGLGISEFGGAADRDLRWTDEQRARSSTGGFAVQPVGRAGDRRENLLPRWIVVLSGRRWIESMDATRIERGPGELSVGDEQAVPIMDQLYVHPRHKPSHVS